MLLSCGAGEDSWESLGLQGDQTWSTWILNRRTDAEAEASVLWPPDAKSWLTGKDSVAGKDWRQKEKGETEDEIGGWHHWLNGHEFKPTLRDKLRTGKPGVLHSMRSQSQTWLTKWTMSTHIHESAGQISPWSFLLYLLRSLQYQEMTFPEQLPLVLLEASAQFIQPPKTLTSILLTPVAAFFIILHPSLSPVSFCQVLPLSLRPKISYSCFSQTRKTPWQLVFYLGVEGSFLFNLN